MPPPPSGLGLRYINPDGSDQVTGLFPAYTYALNCAGFPGSSSGSTDTNTPAAGSKYRAPNNTNALLSCTAPKNPRPADVTDVDDRAPPNGSGRFRTTPDDQSVLCTVPTTLPCESVTTLDTPDKPVPVRWATSFPANEYHRVADVPCVRQEPPTRSSTS